MDIHWFNFCSFDISFSIDGEGDNQGASLEQAVSKASEYSMHRPKVSQSSKETALRWFLLTVEKNLQKFSN